MARQIFSNARQDANGFWWADVTDSEGGEPKRVALRGAPTQDPESGKLRYDVQNRDFDAEAARDLPYWAGNPDDAWRFTGGETLTPEQFQQMLTTINDPALYRNQPEGGFTAESYLADPRASVRMENGQYVYRPDRQQGDIDPVKDPDGGFFNALKEFAKLPAVGMMLAPLGATALSSMGFGPSLGTMGSAEFPTFMGGATGAGGGAAAAGSNVVGSLDSPGALEEFLKSGGVKATGIPGDYTSNVFGPTADFGMGQPLAAGATPPGLSGASMFPAGQTFNIGGATYGIGAGGELVNMATDFAGGMVPGYGTPANPSSMWDLTDPAKMAAATASAATAGTGRENNTEALARMLKQMGIDVAPGTLGLLGSLLGTGLGVYGANQQANAAEDLYNRYMDVGAPYRASLQSLMENPESFYSSPMVQGALQQGTDTLARSLSAKVGNPILNPTALQEMQNYTTRGLMDMYNKQFQNLATAGQFGLSDAARLGSSSVQAQGGVPNALGAGLQSVFGNQRDYASELLDVLKKSGGLTQTGTTYL